MAFVSSLWFRAALFGKQSRLSHHAVVLMWPWSRTDSVRDCPSASMLIIALVHFQFNNGAIQVWVRPVVPKGSFAIGVLNMKDGGYPRKVRKREAWTVSRTCCPSERL